MSPSPRIVTFGSGTGSPVPPEEFGNKAAGLAEIDGLGIRVPPGFALSVSICEEYYVLGRTLPPDVPDLIRQGIRHLEEVTNLGFGSMRRPLLVSVRSGAPVSMPGIMDTILNVGLNRQTVRGLIFMTGNPRFAWDSYRRFLENFSEIILGQDPGLHRAILREAMTSEEVRDETELDSGTLRRIVGEYEKKLAGTGSGVPEDAYAQLEMASSAVLRSWTNPKAEAFKKTHDLSGVRGTGVTVQAMVFGNLGQNSGAGVAFTRNPWTGENELLIDFKFGAQGEDVVSGINEASSQKAFREEMPEVYRCLKETAIRLESHFRDMQDIEFTAENGELYILQSRSGKRAPLAALRIAVELCREGVIQPEAALALLKGLDPGSIVEERVDSPDFPIARGLSASGGVASGTIALSSKRAEEDAREGPVILIRETASPDDIPGISAAAGILTARGARTSHAAVVARELGKVCIVNCSDLVIDQPHHRIHLGGQDLFEGQPVTLDGNTGFVFLGKVAARSEKPLDLLLALQGFRVAVKKAQSRK
jgi:pyruvate,orthophosphate dikinase